jgi:hypothetical protein
MTTVILNIKYKMYVGEMSVCNYPYLMTTVILNIEYKMYPDFLVCIRRLGFGVVTFIDECLIREIWSDLCCCLIVRHEP